MIPRCFLALSLLLTAHAKEISETIFDMPTEAGETIRAEAFQDMIPVSLFSVRKDMDEKALKAALSDSRFDSKDRGRDTSAVGGVTPEECYFENVWVDWEKGRLRNVTLSSNRLPPTQGRLLAFVKEFGRLLGEPVAAYRQVKYDREDPSSLILEWRKGTDTLILSMMRSEQSLDMRMDYYPGPENPGLERVSVRRPKPQPAEPLDKRMASFIEAIAFLPPGDGARPPIPLPEGENGLLAACSSVGATGSILRNRDWVEHKEPHRRRLHEALQKHYVDLEKTEKYGRLLEIAKGKVAGLSSGEIQVGAAAFLGSHDDPEVIEYLLHGMEVELPGGVESECAGGIARQCTGELMDRVIAMFDKAEEWDKATSILSSLATPDQLKELKTKRRHANRPAREQIGNIISLLERYERMQETE